MVQALSPLYSSTAGMDGFSSNSGFTEIVEMLGRMEEQPTSEPQGLSAFSQAYQADIARGDGNQAVKDILAAVKDGTIDRGTAQELLSTVGRDANENGGGEISGECQDAAKAMGFTVDVGQSQLAIGWDKFKTGIENVVEKVAGAFGI